MKKTLKKKIVFALASVVMLVFLILLIPWIFLHMAFTVTLCRLMR